MQTVEKSWGYRLCDEQGNCLETDVWPKTAGEIDSQNPYGLDEIHRDSLSRRLRDARMNGLRVGQLIPVPGTRFVLRAEQF